MRRAEKVCENKRALTRRLPLAYVFLPHRAGSFSLAVVPSLLVPRKSLVECAPSCQIARHAAHTDPGTARKTREIDIRYREAHEIKMIRLRPLRVVTLSARPLPRFPLRSFTTTTPRAMASPKLIDGTALAKYVEPLFPISCCNTPP